MDSKVDWIIHQVIGEEGIVYHTHGLNRHGLTELELNLPIAPKQAQSYVNIIANYLVTNNIIIKDEYVDEKNIFNYNAFFKRVKGIYGNGEENIRIIFPDENGLYPWDNDCKEPYKSQI